MQIRNDADGFEHVMANSADVVTRVRDVHCGDHTPVTFEDSGTTSRPRIVVADPQPLVAEAIERLLTPECAIVGRACDGQMLLHIVQTRHPDIAVMDVAMPLLNGLDAG